MSIHKNQSIMLIKFIFLCQILFWHIKLFKFKDFFHKPFASNYIHPNQDRKIQWNMAAIFTMIYSNR